MQFKEIKTVRRGEIYYFDFGKSEGAIQSGYRPVLILQDDTFNARSPTVIVAPITTVIKKPYLPFHIELGENFGLTKPSMILLEQIQTVNKFGLTDYIGTIDDEQIWKKINIDLKKIFGLWFYSLDRIGAVRCLCPECMKHYLNNPNYIVRRLESFSSSKCKCDKCSEFGCDYIIFDRRAVLGNKGDNVEQQ